MQEFKAVSGSEDMLSLQHILCAFGSKGCFFLKLRFPNWEVRQSYALDVRVKGLITLRREIVER